MRKFSFIFALFVLGVTGTHAQCPSNFEYVDNRCLLFFDNIQTDYLQSRDVCQNLGGDLVIIDDCNFLGSVVSYIEENGYDVPEGYWVGATDVLSEGSFVWNDGTEVPLGAPFWARSKDLSAEPQQGNGDCVAMASGDGYYFHNFDCGAEFGFSPMCETEYFGPGSCPAPYVEIAGHCFEFLITLDEDWEDARTICRATGGDLAIVDDCNVMSSVIKYVQSNGLEPSNGFWIGGQYDGYDWIWLDGGYNNTMAMGVPFWGRDGEGSLQPDDASSSQNCLELWALDRYYLNDVSCIIGGGRSPLCEAVPLRDELEGQAQNDW